jgi:hypothetical protein
VKFFFKDSQLLLPSCCRKKKLLSDAMVAAMLLSQGAAAAGIGMVAAAPLLQQQEQQRQQSLGWSTGGKQWYGSGSFSRNKNCSLQDKLTKPSPRRRVREYTRPPMAVIWPLEVDTTTAATVVTGTSLLGFAIVRTFVYFRMQVGGGSVVFCILNFVFQKDNREGMKAREPKYTVLYYYSSFTGRDSLEGANGSIIDH